MTESMSAYNPSIIYTVDACPNFPFLEMSWGFRVFYGIHLIFMAIFGISANILLMATIILNRKIFFKIEVFHISISQAFLGVLYFVADLTVAVPVIFDSYEYISKLDTMIPLATLNTICYYTEQGFLMAIAINRFIHIWTTIPNRTIYKLTKLLHLFGWFFGACMVIVPSLSGCFKMFSPRFLAFTFSCSNCGETNAYTVTSQAVPLFLICTYTIIILRIYLAKIRVAVHIPLTLQCLCISLPAWIASVVFFFIFSWFPGNAYIGIIPVTLSGIVMFANPLVLFIFNDKLKLAMLDLVLPLNPSESGASIEPRRSNNREIVVK